MIEEYEHPWDITLRTAFKWESYEFLRDIQILHCDISMPEFLKLFCLPSIRRISVDLCDSARGTDAWNEDLESLKKMSRVTHLKLQISCISESHLEVLLRHAPHLEVLDIGLYERGYWEPFYSE